MLFAITNIDKPDSLALRTATREIHLGYLDSIVAQILFAGPLLNAEGQSIGSLIVVEAESQAAAEAFAAADPYAKAGLFESVTVRPYRLVYRTARGRPEAAAMTAYWLVKSEPDAFSWDQQVKNGIEPWTGVRNHTAKNNLKAMKKGDLAFFYHSNIGKEIVGVVRVAREAYADKTAEKGDWVCVDMEAVSPFPKPVTLAAMKEDPALEGLALLRLSRLSVAPVGADHWTHICKLGGWKG